MRFARPAAGERWFIVKLDGAGVSLALSLDNGRTWQRLSASNEILDLTPQMAGGYGYLLWLELHGQPDQAVVRSLEFVTWVQVHPASLVRVSMRSRPMLSRWRRRSRWRFSTSHEPGHPILFLNITIVTLKNYNHAKSLSRLRNRERNLRCRRWTVKPS